MICVLENKNFNLNEINLLKNYFFSKSRKNKITFDNILSDEGGRFYQCQIRYMVLNLTDINDLKVPDKYIWVSHNQMVNLKLISGQIELATIYLYL